ncbi:MAG: hypothetical protein ACRD1R_17535 [Acidobacteriota bacterium]
MPSFGSKSAQALEESAELVSDGHTSLAFNTLVHQCRADRKYHILDLGSAFGENVEFFSQIRCRLYIENFYKTFSSFDYLSPEGDGPSYEKVFEYLLPFPKGTRFDIILTWDLLNYLDRKEFRHLIGHLGHYCQPGTLLLALISTLKHIPEKPINFRIINQEKLLYQNTSTVLRACPHYQQTDFNHLMPDFRVCNSFLLRNGIKEYLFVYGI